MNVRFCDNSFFCKMHSDEFERRSDKLIRIRSISSTLRSNCLLEQIKFYLGQFVAFFC